MAEMYEKGGAGLCARPSKAAEYYTYAAEEAEEHMKAKMAARYYEKVIRLFWNAVCTMHVQRVSLQPFMLEFKFVHMHLYTRILTMLSAGILESGADADAIRTRDFVEHQTASVLLCT
jgi:hypothetical protein